MPQRVSTVKYELHFEGTEIMHRQFFRLLPPPTKISLAGASKLIVYVTVYWQMLAVGMGLAIYAVAKFEIQMIIGCWHHKV